MTDRESESESESDDSGDFMDDMINPELCDGEFAQGMDWNTFADWINEIMCMMDDDDENEDDKEQEEEQEMKENPCNSLRFLDCRQKDECDWQVGVCVWNEAPENRRNLYVMYDWEYLYLDGEKTDDTFCRDKDDDTLYFVEPPIKFCEERDNEDDCLNYGCKGWQKDRCKPQKKLIRCKRLGDHLDKKAPGYEEELAKICTRYSKYPDRDGKKNRCEWNEKKKKCAGKIKLR